MMGLSEDWINFLLKSENKKTLPKSLRIKVVEEFMRLWNLLRHNERPTRVAAKICIEYSHYNVASVLNPYVVKLI